MTRLLIVIGLWCWPGFSEGESCCNAGNIFFEASPRVQPCGCEFYTKAECNVRPTGQCTYRSDLNHESKCIGQLSQKACEKVPICAWRQDFENQHGICFAMLCEPIPCNEILAGENCQERQDCHWSAGICDRNYACSCENTANTWEYCGCLSNKTLCDSRFACSWSDSRGCYDPDFTGPY